MLFTKKRLVIKTFKEWGYSVISLCSKEADLIASNKDEVLMVRISSKALDSLMIDDIQEFINLSTNFKAVPIIVTVVKGNIEFYDFECVGDKTINYKYKLVKKQLAKQRNKMR